MDKDNNSENRTQEDISIGALLRAEREKKGISKRRLAEDIKVREHIIDALENEEWNRLPARVFIKGFIRSYSNSIGYDTNEALKLFDKCSPFQGEDTPKPLTRITKRSTGIYYVIIILIIIAAAIYLFSVRDRGEDGMEEVNHVSDTSSSPVVETSMKESLPEQVIPAETDRPDKIQESSLPVVTPDKDETTDREDTSMNTEEQRELDEENIPATDIDSPVPAARQEGTDTEPETDSIVPPEFANNLSASVNMRTYVKIIIDDNPPREYIFKPGSNPRWTARRGFEVTVGNAGGITFEFNGEKIKNIGSMGKVKKLHFPEDFKTNWEE